MHLLGTSLCSIAHDHKGCALLSCSQEQCFSHYQMSVLTSAGMGCAPCQPVRPGTAHAGRDRDAALLISANFRCITRHSVPNKLWVSQPLSQVIPLHCCLSNGTNPVPSHAHGARTHLSSTGARRRRGRRGTALACNAAYPVGYTQRPCTPSLSLLRPSSGTSGMQVTQPFS